MGLDVENLGSTTFRREDLQRGFEPDSCFYIQHEPAARGRSAPDPHADPPPDLVIEIGIAHLSRAWQDSCTRAVRAGFVAWSCVGLPSGLREGKRAMGQVPPFLRGYLWASYVAAAALVAVHGMALVAWDPFAPVHRPLWPAVALFVALAFIGERFILPITARLWRSLDTAVYIAAILLFPWPLPLLIAVPAVLIERGWRWRHRLPLYKRAFNVAHGLLTVGIADALFARVGAPAAGLRPGHVAAALPALVFLGALYYTLDVAPLLAVHALDTGRAPWRLWAEQHRPVAPLELADLALGALAALVWQYDPLALGLLALPLVAVAAALRSRARASAAEERAATALALAARDGLTGLLNHRAFQERLEEEIARSGRTGRPVALLMVDLDDFGAVNNSHGHQVGDAVLVSIGAALRANVREADVAARYGGDEFAVILPGATIEEAVDIAERIVASVAVAHETGGAIIRVGASVGVATLPGHARTREELILAADRAAYVAKEGGKGRVRPAMS